MDMHIYLLLVWITNCLKLKTSKKKDEVEVINLPVLFLALQMEFPFVRLTTFFRQTSISTGQRC